MSVSASDVRTTLGSTGLSDADLSEFVDKAVRMYEQRIDGEAVTDAAKDDVVEYLAAHLVKHGPEPEIDSGGEMSFNVPDEGRYWRAAVRLDPTGQLAGTSDEDGAGGSDHFTLSI